MAEDAIEIMPAVKPLSLQRAEPNQQRPWQAMGRPGQRQSGNLVDALVGLGEDLMGAHIKQARREQFYEGQNRIVQASLEGTQQQELQNIVKEQPWYSQLLGPDAMTEGAIEQATRVGAGKLFDEQAARLAQGLDVEENPDLYRQRVMDMLRENMTGDPTVDAVFTPKLIAAAQGLVSTQLKKHMARNAEVTMQGVATETYETFRGLQDALRAENGPNAVFNSKVAPDLQGEATQMFYEKMKAQFSKEGIPAGIDPQSWAEVKLTTALPFIKLGNTVIADAMEQSGFVNMLSAKERVEFDNARKDGRAVFLANQKIEALPQRLALEFKLDGVRTREEAAAAMPAIDEYSSTLEGLGLPALTFDERLALGQKTVSAVQRAETRLQNRLDRAAEVKLKHSLEMQKLQAERNVKIAQAEALSRSIVENSKPRQVGDVVVGGNRFQAVPVLGENGKVQFYTPTQKDVEDSYYAIKSTYNAELTRPGVSPEQAQKNARNFLLDATGYSSLEQAALNLQVVDRGTQGQLASLAAESGKPLADPATAQTLSSLAGIAQSDPAFARKFFSDERSKTVFDSFRSEFALSGDAEKAWNKSFGLAVPAKAAKIDTAGVAKSVGSVASAELKQAGGNAPVLRYKLEEAAKTALREGFTQDGSTKSAAQWAVQEVMRNTDIVNGQVLADVPEERKLINVLGWQRSPEAVDAALRRVMVEKYKMKEYTVRYIPGVGHMAYAREGKIVKDSERVYIDPDELREMMDTKGAIDPNSVFPL